MIDAPLNAVRRPFTVVPPILIWSWVPAAAVTAPPPPHMYTTDPMGEPGVPLLPEPALLDVPADAEDAVVMLEPVDALLAADATELPWVDALEGPLELNPPLPALDDTTAEADADEDSCPEDEEDVLFIPGSASQRPSLHTCPDGQSSAVPHSSGRRHPEKAANNIAATIRPTATPKRQSLGAANAPPAAPNTNTPRPTTINSALPADSAPYATDKLVTRCCPLPNSTG